MSWNRAPFPRPRIGREARLSAAGGPRRLPVMFIDVMLCAYIYIYIYMYIYIYTYIHTQCYTVSLRRAVRRDLELQRFAPRPGFLIRHSVNEEEEMTNESSRRYVDSMREPVNVAGLWKW